MEDLLRAPRATLRDLGEGLGLRAGGGELRLPTSPRNEWWRRLSRLFGIHPASTAILADRQGKRPQDPRTAFGADDLEFIRRETGDFLFRLNYEHADFWADPSPAVPAPVAAFSAALNARRAG
jgi:hypothetical protein